MSIHTCVCKPRIDSLLRAHDYSFPPRQLLLLLLLAAAAAAAASSAVRFSFASIAYKSVRGVSRRGVALAVDLSRDALPRRHRLFFFLLYATCARNVTRPESATLFKGRVYLVAGKFDIY